MSTSTLDRPSCQEKLSLGTMCMGSEATLKHTRQPMAMLGEPNGDNQTATYDLPIRCSSEMEVVEPGFALAQKHALVGQLDNEALRRLAANFEQRPGADDEE